MIKSFFSWKYWFSTFLLVLFGVTIKVIELLVSTRVIQLIEFGETMQTVVIFVVVSALVLLVLSLCSNLVDEYLNRYILQTRFDARVELELAYNWIPYPLTFNTKVCDAINVVNKFFSNQTELHTLLDNFNLLLIDVITLVVYIVLITKINIFIITIILVYLILGTVLSLKLKHAITDLKIANSRYERQLEYFEGIFTNYKTREQVYISKYDEIIKQKYDQISKQLLVIKKQMMRYEAINSIILGPSKYLVVLLIITVYTLVNNNPQVSDLWIIVQAFLGIAIMLQSIIDFLTSLRGNKGVLNKIKQYENLKSDEYQEVSAPNFNSLEFENVSFGYGDKLILENCSFVVNRGQSIALVGANGSGKTTIINLMLKLFKPTKGRILLNGQDLQELDDDVVRNIFSVVFQNSVLYPLTLEQNVTLSENKIPEDTFESMKKYFSVFRKYENKMDMQVMKGIEDQSIDLSGGQKQQVAIARAMDQNHQFVIFDEPTSSLDAKSEYQYYQLFNSIFDSKTKFMITHRMSGCKLVDHILFLDNKHIAESGSHQQLLEKAGLYHQFYTVQSERF